MASLLKVAVDGKNGIGNPISDLIASIADGSSGLPATSTSVLPIETVDGTKFDADDAPMSCWASRDQRRFRSLGSSRREFSWKRQGSKKPDWVSHRASSAITNLAATEQLPHPSQRHLR